MTDYARHALVALGAVLSRSQEALMRLDAGEVDQGLAMLKRRAVAFHNFRAGLAIAEKSGIDSDTKVRLGNIVKELSALEPRLKAAVEDALAGTEAMTKKLATAKRKIGRYRSGAPSAPHFSRTV